MLKRVACLVAVFTIGCSDEGLSAPELPRVEFISVSVNKWDIRVGKTTQAYASGFDQYGKPIALNGLKWTASSPAVTVDDSGHIAALAQGQSMVTASVGGKTGTAVMFILPPPQLYWLFLDMSPRVIAVGGSSSPTLSSFDQDGFLYPVPDVKWTVTSTGSGQATVDSLGKVVGVSPGDVAVRATVGNIFAVQLVAIIPRTP